MSGQKIIDALKRPYVSTAPRPKPMEGAVM